MRFQKYILNEEYEYIEFCNFVNSYDIITEGIISSAIGKLKDKLEFMKSIASTLNVGIDSIIKMFKDKRIFKFFQKVGWSMKKLFELAKKGFKLYHQVMDAIAEYISNTKIGKWTEEELKKLDAWLAKHPKTKRIAGIAVAAILIYIWFNMTFTGDFTYDFNMNDLLLALGGTLTLSTLFAGKDGTKLLLLFATGMIGLSFPWPGPSHILFALAVFGTLTTIMKNRIPEIRSKVKGYLK